MVVLINWTTELGGLKTLQGLTPQTNLGKEEGFAPLAPYRDSTIFAITFSGKTAWERHPNGEELVQVLEGGRDLRYGDGRRGAPIVRGQCRTVGDRAKQRSASSPLLSCNEVDIRDMTNTEYVRRDADDARSMVELARACASMPASHSD